MKIEYKQVGDYLLPNLRAPESPTLGKYGMLRHTFLKEHRRLDYTVLEAGGKLSEHLKNVDSEADRMMELLTSQMAKEQGVTERLKESDQMRWVQMMNNIRNAAEEIVLREIVYA